MKIALKILCIACGLYLIYEGYSTYIFSARSPDGSMGIHKFGKFGFFLPATDYSLHLYGGIFMLLGGLLTITPLMRYFFRKNHSSQQHK